MWGEGLWNTFFSFSTYFLMSFKVKKCAIPNGFMHVYSFLLSPVVIHNTCIWTHLPNMIQTNAVELKSVNFYWLLKKLYLSIIVDLIHVNNLIKRWDWSELKQELKMIDGIVKSGVDKNCSWQNYGRNILWFKDC